MGWERHAVAQVATGASCVDARPIAVGVAAVAHSSTASASPSIEPLLRSLALSTKGASQVHIAGGDGLRAPCSRSGCYRSQLRWP